MNISSKSLLSVLGSLALALVVSGVAVAQDSTPQTDVDKSMRSDMKGMKDMDGMKGMHGEGMSGSMMGKSDKGMGGNMMGMHRMPATVTAVDADTGVVDVTSAGMALKVHFPPSALADLKVGDEITLHLGFSKP